MRQGGRAQARVVTAAHFSSVFVPPRTIHGRASIAGLTPRALAVVVATLLLTLAPPASRVMGAEVEPAVHAAAAGAHQGQGAGAQEQKGEGEGEGEHAEHAPSINPKTLGLQLLNFAVLLFILVKFGGGAINKALAARHHQLKADLASAADLRAAAEAKLKLQESRLSALEHEIADMRRGIKAEAESEKARLIAAAEERAARIKAETTFLVEQQVREAEVRLRRQSADSALKLAEEILRRSIGAGDQQKFLDTFVAEVEQSAGAATSRVGGAV